jgi:hypothetical protein
MTRPGLLAPARALPRRCRLRQRPLVTVGDRLTGEQAADDDVHAREPDVAAATEDYRRLWADEGSRIVAALESITGIGFFQGNINAIVYEGVSFSGNRDTPMRLRASYSPDGKRSSLVHELGHRLISQLTIRPSDLDEHRVLDLVLYDAWESLWGVEFATRQVHFESGP